MKFHFGSCQTDHKTFQCGHCACIFTDWHTFIMHINAKGMSLLKPFSEQFSWHNISNWQNPKITHYSDILNVAMQHANLPTLQVGIPTVSTSFRINSSAPVKMETSSCPSVFPSIPNTVVMSPLTVDNPSTCHASNCTQTTPIHHLCPTNDLETPISCEIWQLAMNNLHSPQEHVNALLQLNLLLAQLLLYRTQSDTFLSAHEQFVLQTSVAQFLWPNTFLHCSTVSELCNVILTWLYEQF